MLKLNSKWKFEKLVAVVRVFRPSMLLLQRTAKKCTKICNVHARPLFCSILPLPTLIFVWNVTVTWDCLVFQICAFCLCTTTLFGLWPVRRIRRMEQKQRAVVLTIYYFVVKITQTNYAFIIYVLHNEVRWQIYDVTKWFLIWKVVKVWMWDFSIHRHRLFVAK